MTVIISVSTINLLLKNNTPFDSNESKIKKLILNGLLLSDQTYLIKETNELIHTNITKISNNEDDNKSTGYSDFEEEVYEISNSGTEYSDFEDETDDSDF